MYRGCTITDLEGLKKAIVMEWRRSQQDCVDNAIDVFRPTIRKFVQENGDHIIEKHMQFFLCYDNGMKANLCFTGKCFY